VMSILFVASDKLTCLFLLEASGRLDVLDEESPFIHSSSIYQARVPPRRGPSRLLGPVPILIVRVCGQVTDPIGLTQEGRGQRAGPAPRGESSSASQVGQNEKVPDT
jgi:hypothetical protein